MWTISSGIDGVWTRIEVIELRGEAPSSAAVRELALARLEGAQRAVLLRHLDREIDFGPDGSRDAIEIWSGSAEAESLQSSSAQPRFVARDQALALYLSPENTPDEEPAALAWHDRTAVIIPVDGRHDLRVEYTPEAEDVERSRQLARYSSAQKRETIFEWRGYFGEESVIADDWQFLGRQGRGVFLRAVGMPGALVGYVLNRIIDEQPQLREDPTAKRRLHKMTDRFKQIAEACPDLGEKSAKLGADAVVFIHGTVSCGIEGLKDLYQDRVPHADPDQPMVYRYEHDTFQPLSKNAEDLVALVLQSGAIKRLLLVGHSRGGLVARMAHDMLAKQEPLVEVTVYTFGTPHSGTPLVSAGAKVLNLLFKLGDYIVDGIPMVGAFAKGCSYLIDAPELPPGISVMREDSDALHLLNFYGDAKHVPKFFCWGSAMDIHSGPSGFGILEGFLHGLLRERGNPDGGNDLVVPVKSALFFGTRQPILNCSHSQYFLQEQVRARIGEYLSRADQRKRTLEMQRRLRELAARFKQKFKTGR